MANTIVRAGVMVAAEPKPGAPIVRTGRPKFARLRMLKNWRKVAASLPHLTDNAVLLFADQDSKYFSRGGFRREFSR